MKQYYSLLKKDIMPKKISLALVAVLLVSTIVLAQADKQITVHRVPSNSVKTIQVKQAIQNPGATTTATPATTNTNTAQDKFNQFEISAIGGTSFTAFNNYDGSPASYTQNQQITISLVPVAPSGSYNFQLVFYSPSQKIAQAAFYDQGVLQIHYPMSMYADIKEKLNQAFMDKRKVSVRVLQKANGYLEGSIDL
jgi:hypothetical protein